MAPMPRNGLNARRHTLLALLALLALVLGQAAALLHGLKHDAAGAPATHSQVCLECASFAPLASPHGATTLTLIVAALATWVFVCSFERPSVARRPVRAFRSRAPPR
jgi:hypothetical protein